MHGPLSATASVYILGGEITRKTSHLSILLQPGIKIIIRSKSSSLAVFNFFLLQDFCTMSRTPIALNPSPSHPTSSYNSSQPND
jgi:hypothetical protein